MSLTAAACAGFLIAVLWMDLIFDTQVLPHRGADVLPEAVLASISGYYHRATTTSRPMSYLIAAAMAILLGALCFRWFDRPGWLMFAATLLAGIPILLASIRTVPYAKRLGNRIGTPVEQSRLARSICRDHLLCLVCMSAFLAVWLVIGSQKRLAFLLLGAKHWLFKVDAEDLERIEAKIDDIKEHMGLPTARPS